MKKRLEDDFAVICERMTQETAAHDSAYDFIDLCEGLASGQTAIQNLFYKMYGMSGNEVLNKLRGF